MLPNHHWAYNFVVEEAEIEHIKTLLLEKETPLSSEHIAAILVEKRLKDEAAILEERYKDAYIYNPADSYEIGQKLVFPVMDYATAEIADIRPGENETYGEFEVAIVQFNGEERAREFAISLTKPHKLSQGENGDNGAAFLPDTLTAEDLLNEVGDAIMDAVEDRLQLEEDLISVARKWFAVDLMLEMDEGQMNLAEAVLDINGGGPLATTDILEQMGGLGTSPISLQVFSANYYLNEDKRFDEVGPTGEVLWYLTRMEPQEVQRIPPLLQYTPIEHDRSLLGVDGEQLEREIGDELSPLEPIEGNTEGTVTLIYPHRRSGTLPLNYNTIHVFPTARRTRRVWLTLVDGQDDTEYTGWVIPQEGYVYGLADLYRKYSLPIGAYVTVSKTDDPGKIRVDFSAYRPRTEWVRLLRFSDEQVIFENDKRAIGADYDDLTILGIDDLVALDAWVKNINSQRRTLAAILRMVIPGLARLTPQGTAHAKTIYSAVNVVRRMPPGPILATLQANPDFQNVGGHYWKLAE